MDLIAPIKSMRVKSISAVPWYDKDLVTLSKHRNKLHNRALKTKSKVDWSLFKQIRNKFNKLYRNKKSSYLQHLVSTLSTSSRLLWKKLKPYLKPNSHSTIVPSLFCPNSFATDSDAANIFSNFFSKILD